MRINAKALPFALALAAQKSERTSLKITAIRAERPLVSLPEVSRRWRPLQTDSSSTTSSMSEPVSIYAVDDKPILTEIYTSFLEKAGYFVKTFNDRLKALAALKGEKKLPHLLITDYLGFLMPADDFMHACRAIHPGLRILMASGFDRRDMRLPRACPDSFIEKPFTPEELIDQVRIALVG